MIDYDETDRTYGIGAGGEVLGDQEFKRSAQRNRRIMNLLEDIEDYRPFFTYWVTTTQLLVMFISLRLYGFGPVGVELYHGKGQVSVVTKLKLDWGSIRSSPRYGLSRYSL